MSAVEIAIIGDYDAENATHTATDAAIQHAAARSGNRPARPTPAEPRRRPVLDSARA